MRIVVPGGSSHDAGRHSGPKSVHQPFADRYKSGQLNRLTQGSIARQIKLADQYRLAQKGDVARQLRLFSPATPGRAGRPYGGPHHVQHGPVSTRFAAQCFRYRYHGPSYFAGIYWYPHWNGWVTWSWGYHCNPLFDPRPLWCRPIIYAACPRWVWWQTPVWAPLPVVACGTWVDVAPVRVGPQYDLQLLAVRFVDPGHPEQKIGPRYRVWYRNNSTLPITRPFNVMLLAGNGTVLGANLQQAGVRVTAMDAGDIQSVDIRLPMEVYQMGRDALGNPASFTTLNVLVDANRELPDVSRSNNGAQLAAGEILPVDPAAFGVKPDQVAAGGEVLLAGEGFGPEPGRVLVHLGGIEMEAEIRGWYDLGVQVAVPNLPLAAATPAELIVVRGDGAAANPIAVTIQPPQAAGPMILPPPPGP